MPKNIKTKSEEYFEKIEQGWTIRDIANHFNCAVSTVRTHLKKHPQYEAPGSGNRISSVLPESDRRISKDYKVVYTPIQPELNDQLDLIAQETSQTKNAIVRRAISEYCDRYRKAKTRSSKKSKK